MAFSIELEREDNGPWLAEVPLCPACCATTRTAMKRLLAVLALALRAFAERLEHRKSPAELVNVTFQTA